jgi:hypothetical protein
VRLVLNWYQVLYPITGSDGGHSLDVIVPPGRADRPTARTPRPDDEGNLLYYLASYLSNKLSRSSVQCVNLAAAAAPGRSRMPGSRGAAVPPSGHNVETPHPVETKHAYSVFCFHQTKSFHAKRSSVPDGRAAVRRAVPQGTMSP